MALAVDLRTVSIEPQRQTYNHIARRLGADKPASRYLEGTMDLQAEVNFHYRPTWDPERELHDPRRTAIEMKDWYAFKDPRQYYYGSYCMARARMQDTAEGDFSFVEQRGLAENYDATGRRIALDFYVPLRHVAWGANLNGAYQVAYGYGTAITQACQYASLDQLAIGQYLTRLGLLLGGTEALDAGKHAWMQAPAWQPLRKLVEDSWVVKDWFELFVLQNVLLDGVLFNLAYREVDAVLSQRAGPAVSMLTRFQVDWFAEVSRWVDATIKVAAAENEANKERLQAWHAEWRGRVLEALDPVAQLALGADAAAALERSAAAVDARMQKAGLAIASN